MSDMNQNTEIPLESRDGVKGPTISFHDLQYIVKAKENKKRVQKYVLKDVSGIFSPGMNAILGPTGSGKTSLLDFLAGRKGKAGFTGTILVNGQKLPQNFKNISGYVVQDDVVMGTLTVFENLSFSAALRLPKSISAAEKKQRVIDIIEELGLTDCKNTKVGTEFSRGVSGGERKRVNIGMELITKPGVLFLDEPTTGLDSSTAAAVISLLHSLSLKGKTIIFSIHQPRFSIFRHFDKLHLLSKGQTVFHGRAENCLEFFASAGHQCEEHNNPPDFFLDVILQENASVVYVSDDLNSVEKGRGGSIAANGSFQGKSLISHYKTTSYCHDMKTEADKILQGNKDDTSTTFNIGYASSWFTQLYFVSKRAGINFIRNPQVSIFQPLVTVFFAVIVGALYWQIGNDSTSGIQNRVGVLFFLVTNMLFSNAAASELFIKERVIFIHESASGYYRVSTYFLAKIFCDLLPMRMIPTLIYCLISYWMIGLVRDLAKFLIFSLSLLLTTLAGTAVTFFWGATCGTSNVATLATTLTYVVMLIFGGLFLNITSLPLWIRWIQYLSIARLGLNALSANELEGQMFCDDNGLCINGTEFLVDQGIVQSDDGDTFDVWYLWRNVLALGVMIIGLLILSYIQLRRIPKTK